MTQQQLKQQAAQAAIDLIVPQLKPEMVLGVGTGSTVDLFIDLLAEHKGRFKAAVSSSERSTARMQGLGVAVTTLDELAEPMPFYVDGADEIDTQLRMIKGGGGALTREKIVASAARQFVCIVDATKLVERLGAFPLPVEVIPMARAIVARRLQEIGGHVLERAGFLTDNGCVILDVAGLNMLEPEQLEATINDIPGVVTCGLFALSAADVALVAHADGVRRLSRDA
ncbi:ribose-5-phosphate isomerase RpiA [Pusillimonas sp. CC-YST705]|uniref:Ribose-5-phosphate isomerase A n=1 Tax=Mesopusillimonas faecipullorum TaxID=2755040 RepID=A0ABS8CFM1_9BURK|nr:ribose-5-phosphate isomerase RpiA [Mesopusillimonas faecipullorum]MCB5364844.1 ribose-5-phosphate isomerase RpiA [Mesopusillimonas faecipullorum]